MEQLTRYLELLNMTEWLMIAVIMVLVASLVSMRRQRKLQQQQSLSMQSLQRDLRALANAAVGVGERVLVVERQQRKQQQVVPTQPTSIQPVELYDTANQPYEQAIRMAQNGASVDDIVNICGLSVSEAELITMMHRLDKAS
jgi:biopolymer transport protein ExbB/TolQ